MHPIEERPQGYWEVDDPPDPTVARTTEEFAAELAVLLEWSQLPISEIEMRARAYGRYVPEGAVSDALRGNTLPSEELLVEMLWAIGCDEETIGLWLWARNNLAAAQASFDPTDVFRVPDQPPRNTNGALANAVEERRDQGWRGLHRHAIPEEGDTNTRYTPKRLRVKESTPSTGWALKGLVAAGVLALIAGGVAVLTAGGESAAPTPAAQGCCPESGGLGSQTPSTLVTDLPTATPDPNMSTRPGVNPTPRPSSTTKGPSPTPSQTQGQQPRLTGSGNASCTGGSGTWVVTVTVEATLAEAASGTNPQGQAGLTAGSMSPFSLSGSGSTFFTGQATVETGVVNTEPANGTIQWTVTVTVPSGGTVETSGSEGFNCAPETPQ